MATVARLGIDVGTQGVRAVVLDDDGLVRGQGESPLPAGRRADGRHEQDPADWWTALAVAVRTATAELPRGLAVTALALDATSGTVLVEDGTGAAQGPALMYDDARATVQAERAQSAGHAVWSDLGYRLQPSWALPKILWLVEAGAVPRGGRVVHQADHLVGRLLARPASTDTSTALKTGADPRTVTWPADVLEALGVPVGLLPGLVRPGDRLGTVDVEVARGLGLPEGVEVRAGMTDGCAAQIATGALEPGSWSSALGTTLVLKGATTDLVRDPAGAVYCHRSPDGTWLPGGASSTGAGALARWLPGADLPALTVAAARRPRPTTPCYPLAGRGERFPFVAPQAEGFVPPVVLDDQVELFSSIAHGIAYVERLAYDTLARLGADVSGPVAVSGGTARNDWWNQLAGRPARAGGLPTRARGRRRRHGRPRLGRARRARGHRPPTGPRRAWFEPDAGRGADLLAGYHDLVDRLVERGWVAPSVAEATR